MTTHDIIVIGASAGGVEAISSVVAQLPRDIRAVVLRFTSREGAVCSRRF